MYPIKASINGNPPVSVMIDADDPPKKSGVKVKVREMLPPETFDVPAGAAQPNLPQRWHFVDYRVDDIQNSSMSGDDIFMLSGWTPRKREGEDPPATPSHSDGVKITDVLPKLPELPKPPSGDPLAPKPGVAGGGTPSDPLAPKQDKPSAPRT